MLFTYAGKLWQIWLITGMESWSFPGRLMAWPVGLLIAGTLFNLQIFEKMAFRKGDDSSCQITAQGLQRIS
jgi:hypothetical protein